MSQNKCTHLTGYISRLFERSAGWQIGADPHYPFVQIGQKLGAQARSKVERGSDDSHSAPGNDSWPAEQTSQSPFVSVSEPSQERVLPRRAAAEQIRGQNGDERQGTNERANQ